MEGNPALRGLGRRLRLGLIGGGRHSQIGEIHRKAARLEDIYEIAASALSSDPERSRVEGRALGLDSARAYGSVGEMLEEEAHRDDMIDAVAILTPNHTHYAFSCAAMERGLDVICENPLTTDLEEALDLVRRVRQNRLAYCPAFAHSGYPMIRQARAMIRRGELGVVRMVQAEYIGSRYAIPFEKKSPGRLGWRADAAQSGPSLILAETGGQAQHLIGAVTGQQIARVAADLGNIVPGREFDDTAAMHLRLQNGARGTLVLTQAASGADFGLALRVFGDLGGLEWREARPGELLHTKPGQRAELINTGTPNLAEDARRVIGGFAGQGAGQGAGQRASQGAGRGAGPGGSAADALANVYADVAEVMVGRRSAWPASQPALEHPNAEDGARAVAFIDAAVRSGQADGAWTDCGINV